MRYYLGVKTLAAGVTIVLAVACGSAAPTSPTSPTAVTAAATVTSPPPASTSRFPPESGPFRTFVFDRELSHPVAEYTRKSRFLLYDNGAFVLDYQGLGLRYRGAYRESEGVVTFEWEGWSAAGPWGATATATGDSLTVRFNVIMQLTDFEDAVYALSR
jgi:hypothetical protein